MNSYTLERFHTSTSEKRLVVDTSAAGRSCITSTLNEGHVVEDMHMALLDQAAPLIPESAEVVIRGDGASPMTTRAVISKEILST